MGLFDAIGGVVGGIAGLFGDQSGGSGTKQQAADLIARVQLPGFDMRSLTPEELRIMGQINPEMMQALQGPEAQTARTDQTYRQAQMDALRQMQRVGQEGGMTLEDKANLANIQSRQGRNDRASQEAILSNMAARGAGGSGNELAARLASQQEGANQANLEGINVAGQAQSRALQAMQGAGELGGMIGSQDLNEKQRAADIINQFNMSNFANRQDILNQNTGMRNDAQLRNLGLLQSTSDQNVGLRNQYASDNLNRQNTLKQQDFTNQMGKATANANALQEVAKSQDAQSAARQQQARGFGTALGGLAGSAFGGGSSSGSSNLGMNYNQDPYNFFGIKR